MNEIEKYLGYTFYALDATQMDKKVQNTIGRIEAILFNREDLRQEHWDKAWENIKKAVNMYGNYNVSFHFPVNESDYINDVFVRNRLIEALKRGADLGIRLIVLHSNQRLLLDEWKNINIQKKRSHFINELYNIVNKADKNIIVGLENMPPIGNLNDDAEPLFLFPSDFKSIDHPQIKITFDINHFFNVIATMKTACNDKAFKNKLPIYSDDCDFFDFEQIKDKIVHWHFSGFHTIANPIINQITKEGCCPWESRVVEEDKYAKAAKFIIENNKIENQKSVIFEVEDCNYSNRINVLKTVDWFKRQAVKNE